jgi:hypothetical protein
VAIVPVFGFAHLFLVLAALALAAALILFAIRSDLRPSAARS